MRFRASCGPKRERPWLLIAGVMVHLAFVLHCHASGESYIVTSAREGAFALAAERQTAPLHASLQDHAGVLRVLGHLQKDIERVTSTLPGITIGALPPAGGTPSPREIVLVGTLGRNPWIDTLVRQGRITVQDIAGQRESYLIQVVETPFAGFDKALVIAGSDKRGTIYGMYDLSSRIGVSPWYWWADVAPKKYTDLFVLPGRHVQGPPKVKYRGIFINDEAPALSGWTQEKFGGFNAEFYEHVFELILRLRGNFLWPAMWGNAFYDDDPRNPELADEYGIVIGTSHHEPMMRAHDEWRRYGSGSWNYAKNDSALRQFWREGIQRMGSKESIVTLGMRGDGDEPMSAKADIALLETIVRDQRQILGDVTGKDLTDIPQVWALYKEVQEYYDKGMRVPDDVTLLLCDDNWGNIRKLPNPHDPPRAGGYGIYYHYDFVGGPRNYKWVNTNQIARIWEQMSLAYEYGAREIWIVNVGDIKPMEYPIEFFLEYAWNPESWDADRVSDYPRLWAERKFGSAHARDIGEILTLYTMYNSRRKPELLSPNTFSLVDYREAETVVREYTALVARARKIYESIPAADRDAFYQLVLHPVEACANLNALYLTVGLNRLYAGQGRASTNALAAKAESLFAMDAAISAYYNKTLAGGKWNHMMDQTHISYTTWQQPDRDTMPEVKTVEPVDGAELGVAIEGSDRWWPHDSSEAVLPEFDPYNRQSYYVEIFNRGAAPLEYAVQVGEKYLKLSRQQGRIASEERLLVSVDWEKAPRGKHRIPITITGPKDPRVVVHAVMNNPPTPDRNGLVGFVEGNGCVSVEAEHYTAAVTAPPIVWERIPGIGRTLSGMTVTPVTSARVEPGGMSPHLEYRMLLFSAGEVKVHTYLSPTLNFRSDDRQSAAGLRYAVSFDDQPPVIVNMHARDTIPDWKYPQEWNQSVANNIRILTSRHVLDKPGEHTLKFWLVDPGIVLQKLVVDAGGVKPSYLGPPESFHRIPPRTIGHTDGPGPGNQGNQTAHVSRRTEKEFANPVLAGFYPDPSICRVGDDYYLVTSTFAYFPGIPVFHSRDLVNWSVIGHVMDRPEQLNLDGQGVSRGLFAPSIRYHDGKFYVTCTLVDIGGNFVATAASPGGPWSNPVWIPEINGIDPSMFFDDDGKAYVLYNSIPPDDRALYNGHRTLRMYEFDTQTLKVKGEERLLVNGGTDITKKPVWIEAPHIFRHNGYYYLIAAEGGTGDNHSEVVFRSNAVGGPYIPYEQNPILTQRHLDTGRPSPITATGHADFVQTQNGDWWAVFLGCRPYPPLEKGYYNTGRETFLAPVRWTEGWPVITSGEELVPYTYPLPLPLSAPAPAPYGGNFTVKYDFDRELLHPNLVFLRTPHQKWFDLRSRKGHLTMKLRPETCSGTMNPSFIGHRQQHLRGSASTEMTFSPGAANEKAGMLIFQNEQHYYFLCKSIEGNSPVVQLYKAAAGDSSGLSMELIASQVLSSKDHSRALRLKIEAHDDTYAFCYAVAGETWKTLKDRVDAAFLSTRVAGGFVGCMYALYATSLGRPASRSASFDWFEYTGNDEAYEDEDSHETL